jgi:hypothetical protein
MKTEIQVTTRGHDHSIKSIEASSPLAALKAVFPTANRGHLTARFGVENPDGTMSVTFWWFRVPTGRKNAPGWSHGIRNSVKTYVSGEMVTEPYPVADCMVM